MSAKTHITPECIEVHEDVAPPMRHIVYDWQMTTGYPYAFCGAKLPVRLVGSPQLPGHLPSEPGSETADCVVCIEIAKTRGCV